MRRWIYILGLCLAACEKPTEWTLHPQPDDRVVVEGLLTNEKKAHRIRLSRAVPELNQAAEPVSGADVSLFDGDTTIRLAEDPPGSGSYLTDPSYQGVVDKTYELVVQLDTQTFMASATMIPVTPLDPLIYSKNNDNGLYFIRWINEPYAADPAMYKLYLDWSFVEDYDSLPADSNTAQVNSYTFNTLDVSQLFAPDRESLFFPEGTIIIEKKYSLTPEYSAFLRALVAETEWRGGYFDSQAANLPTNLSEGAIGFFAASTVITDTIIVEP